MQLLKGERSIRKKSTYTPSFLLIYFTCKCIYYPFISYHTMHSIVNWYGIQNLKHERCENL